MGSSPASPKILVAPLDWGLGHATRCIPIIRKLLAKNCQVVLASEGRVAALLQAEFPQLPLLPLPGYNIEYASSNWGMAPKIVAQIPKIISAIKHEQEWLQQAVKEEKIDAVISDNRYGLYSNCIPAVFITHQLRIKAPVSLAEEFLQDLNYSHINKFSQCWVPDWEGDDNLAGALSHPAQMPSVPTQYIGCLSRFEEPDNETANGELLVMLSGPEPQRSLLEEQLLGELKDYTKPVVFVRGLPGNSEPLTVADNVAVYPHLPAAELEAKIKAASLVIARCGYSTVMDLAVLKKRSILIPTPGQTEQEYLAGHLMQKNFAFCVAQKKFRLGLALSLANSFSYRPFFQRGNQRLQNVINALLSSLKN